MITTTIYLLLPHHWPHIEVDSAARPWTEADGRAYTTSIREAYPTATLCPLWWTPGLPAPSIYGVEVDYDTQAEAEEAEALQAEIESRLSDLYETLCANAEE